MKEERLGFQGFLFGRMDGFTEEEKGVITQFAEKHINGEQSIAIPFGKGKIICCPLVALRGSEVAEKHGRDGVTMVNDFLWGRNNPIGREDALNARCALQDFRRDFFKKMKGEK